MSRRSLLRHQIWINIFNNIPFENVPTKGLNGKPKIIYAKYWTKFSKLYLQKKMQNHKTLRKFYSIKDLNEPKNSLLKNFHSLAKGKWRYLSISLKAAHLFVFISGCTFSASELNKPNNSHFSIIPFVSIIWSKIILSFLSEESAW